MVSKSNHSQKLTMTAERQSHFGIRKLTIGTVSVLIGTTLWMGNRGETVHASSDDTSNQDQEQKSNHQVTNTQNTKKVVVVKDTAAKKASSQAVSQSAAQTKAAAQPAKVQASSEQSSVQNKQAEPQTKDLKQAQPKQATSSAAIKFAEAKKANQALKQAATVNAAHASKLQASSKTDQAGSLGKIDKANSASSQELNFEKAALQVSKAKLKSDLNASLISDSFFNGPNNKNTTDEDIFDNPDKNQTATSNQNAQNTQTTNDFQTVSDWSGIQSAINSNAKGVNITGTISGFGNLNLNYGQNFTINGENGASLGLYNNQIVLNGGSNLTLSNLSLQSTNQTGAVTSNTPDSSVTFDNVKSQGAGLFYGQGDVHIKGNTTSNVSWGAPTPSNSQITYQLGNNTQGLNTSNWYNANIVASNVYIDPSANFTIERGVNGDGIVVNNQAGMGHVDVGKNATLTVNLVNGTNPMLAATEQSNSAENANTAIWATQNGSFTTGVGATVNLNVGHGRGVVFGEPVGGTSTIYGANNMANWYNDRTVSHGGSSQFKLGEFTNFNLYGRDGVLIGDNAQFITGEHSVLKFNNQGNGVGLDVDAQAHVEISPHSVVDMESNGKNRAGIWNGGNYISLGENAQMTVDHDATFKYHLTNAWTNGSPNYVDNFNIVSVKSSSHPTMTIANDAIFDGQSDYRNIFGEIVSFSYNDAPNGTTVNIDGARYVNFQKNAITTPGAFQNVVPYDPEGKHTGNLFYSWPHNIWNVGNNTYNAYKWQDEVISRDTFDNSSFDAFKKSIQDLNNSSSEYWTGIKGLTLAYNMHRSHLENVNPNPEIGVKNGWNADNSQGYGFDPEFSQRVALVATTIPTQEDKVTDNKDDLKVIIKYDKNLKPGEAKVIQKGVAGRVITINRTYYIVNVADPSNPIRTVDTSKGQNGHETISTTVTEGKPEIIAIGPQTATINYVDKANQEPIDYQNQPIIGTATACPVATNADGEVIFNSDGLPTAATIEYNQAPDLEKAKEAGYPIVVSNEWETKPHLYNVNGLTRDAILQAAQNGTQLDSTGPTFKVVLDKRVTQKYNVKVIFHDVTTDTNIPNVGGDTGNYDPDTPTTDTKYTPDKFNDDLKKLENEGYVPVNPDAVPTMPTVIPDQDQTIQVNMKHGIVPVNPENPGKPDTPINPNDPTGPKYPAGTDKTSLEKTITRTIVYEGAGDKTPAKKVQSVEFTASGYLDKVTGKWVTETGNSAEGLTWSAKNGDTLASVAAIDIPGYHVVNTEASSNGENVKAENVSNDGAVKELKVTHNGYDIKVTIQYAPDGTEIRNKKSIPTKQIVHYEGASSLTPKDNIQDGFTFEYSGDVYNKTTGQLIQKGSWNAESHKYDSVKTPVVDGYYANEAEAAGQTVTITKPEAVVTVVYKPLGHIVPVDPEGKPIPNAPTPQYKNNPDNPTKVTPNEPVPTIPGYTPEVPTVTPTNPGQDTPVKYTKDKEPTPDQGSVTVTYHDDTTNSTIPDTGYNSGKKDVDTPVDYNPEPTIKKLENEGYVPVEPIPTIPAKIEKGTHNIVIHMKHGTTTVTPNNPGHPGEPINPNDPNGPKYPANSGENDLEKTGKQTIHYTGAGDKTPKDNVETTSFTKTMTIDKVTGKIISQTDWTPDSHKFNTVNTPIVEGYHADKAVAGGLTATPEKPDVSETITYSPNGHIVPVDPEGKPIPNAPTPQYKNDPDNPTKVTPNEPVPTIPGYTPEVPTVTPTNPGKDTDVKYVPDTPETVTGQVQYIDQTDNNKVMSTVDLKGTVGKKIDYDPAATIKNYENQGYDLVSNNFKTGEEIYHESGNDFKIIFKHGTTTVTPNNPGHPGEPINPNDPNGPKYPANSGENDLEKTGKQTIHYTGAGDETPKDNVETTSFTKTMTIDKVTGKVISQTDWVPTSHKFNTVNTPIVEGYHADKAVAGGLTATPDKPDVTDTVTYSPNGHIVPVDPEGKPIPNAPTPQYPTNPDNPTKVTSNEPVPTIPGYTPEVPTVTPTNPGKDTDVKYVPDTPETVTGLVTYYDATAKAVMSTVSLKGEIGSKINYDPQTTIENYEKQGYVFQSSDFRVGQESFQKSGNDFRIVFIHGKTTYNPDNPAHPGTPINPQDPNGPKITQDMTDYDKTYKATVEYTGAGKHTPANNVQTSTWTRSITVDKVTGKIISTTPWTTKTTEYKAVKTPVVPDYYANKGEIPAIKAEMKDITNTVTYSPNGHIIPVDPEGKPIPGADHPVFPTDPKDPTRTTDGTIPNVSGYTPENSKPGNPIAPNSNPGKDVNVPYIKNPDVVVATGSVTYIDDTTGKDLLVHDLKGNVGEKITYTTTATIQNYENIGYKLVSSNFENGKEIFKEKGNTFTVHLAEELVPVGPNNPHTPGTPINPLEPNGPKWPSEDTYSKNYTSTVKFVTASGKQLMDDNVQTSTWTRTLIINKVTGEITNPNIAWTPNITTYKKVKAPSIAGYTANKEYAGGEKVVQKDLVDQIIYSPNGKIVPVLPDGTPIPNTTQPTYQTSPDNPTQVVPNEPVPDIPGYTPSQTSVTPKDPTKDTKVVYTPVADQAGIRVDFKDTTTGEIITYKVINGKMGDKITYSPDQEIKNLENQGYKLVHNGYNPGAVFNKTNNGKTYTISLEHATITYDPDNPAHPGTPINPQYPDGPKVTQDMTDYDKTYKSTVHYEGAGESTPKDNVQTSTWTRQITVDRVTGKIIKTTAWTTKTAEYKPVKTPDVFGYQADKSEIPAIKPEMKDITNTVTYTKVVQPTPTPEPTPEPTPTPTPTPQPQPTPTPEPTPTPTPQPTPPTNDQTIKPHPQTVPTPTPEPTPTPQPIPNKIVPATVKPHPQTIEKPKTKVKTAPVKPQTIAKKQVVASVGQKGKISTTHVAPKQQKLPQTGEENNNAAILGAAAAAISMIGLAGVKKRRKN